MEDTGIEPATSALPDASARRSGDRRDPCEDDLILVEFACLIGLSRATR